MNEILFEELPLPQQAAQIQEKGQFIEAQDFYSFFTLVYLFNDRHMRLIYDFSGVLVAVENVDETPKDNYVIENFNRRWTIEP